MPNIQVPAASADLTGNGNVAGYVTVGSNAAFYPGCVAWLINNDAGSSKRCLIVKLVSTDKIYVRFLPEENQGYKFPAPSAGYSDCTAFTTAKSSRINMEAQLAPVDPASDKALV